ncbi:MAG: rhodanese-like domain-containing protein [Acidobacteria bacterium]|nr:rhodanese-like domain-containing protein [Acidobacteriota bacterium]
MLLALISVFAVALFLFIFVSKKRREQQDQIEQHSISAEELHSQLSSDRKVQLFDVRQPLDVLAYPDIIPGAQRIAPQEVLERPSLIPKDKDVVVYCTCPSDKTSRAVLRQAIALQFSRIKFLRGGLAAWKAKGYPVEPYRESIQLRTAISPP